MNIKIIQINSNETQEDEENYEIKTEHRRRR